MLVALAKISLSYWNLAMRAETEFDSCIAAGEVGTNKFLAMADIFRNNEIGRLKIKIIERVDGKHKKTQITELSYVC